MRLLTLSALLFFISAGAFAQKCATPVDPKKVVVMLAFNEAGTELKGAEEGACARGERLVVFPIKTPQMKAIEAQKKQLEVQLRPIADRYGCVGDSCEAIPVADRERIQGLVDRYIELNEQAEAAAPNIQENMRDFLNQSKANGVKISSMIISGHDGGGHFYGDNGETTMAEITELTSLYPETFHDLSALLLMGCWSGTPDQVDMWKGTFPKMRVLGGFVGSAPASTRAASGTYISGLLRGERRLPQASSKAAVQAMINQVQHINMVTAGVFIAPSCVEDENGAAYYYVSPAQSDNELPEDMHAGLSTYRPVTDQEQQCITRFEENYDWERVGSYFFGEKEPENSPELRGIYSYLRNNEYCFTQGFVQPEIGPDEVLFLRFYQDMKKNFGKFHKQALEDMYKALDELVGNSEDLSVKAAYQAHKKLMGQSLTAMNRAETLEQISNLTQVFDKIASANPDAPQMPQIRQTMQIIDTQLHRLKCMPPTWHEYVEGETLRPPTCSSAD